MSADFSQAFWSHFTKTGGAYVQLKPLRFSGDGFTLGSTLRIDLREFARGLVLEGQGATISWAGGNAPMLQVVGENAKVGIAMSDFYLSGEFEAAVGLWVEGVKYGPSSFRLISVNRTTGDGFRVRDSSSVVFESCQAFSETAKPGTHGWVVEDCAALRLADCGATDHAGDGVRIDIGPDDVVDVTGVQSERNRGAGVRVKGNTGKGAEGGLRLVSIRGGFIEGNHLGGIVLEGHCTGVQVSDLRLVSYGAFKGPAVLTDAPWDDNIVTDNLVSAPEDPTSSWTKLPPSPGRVNLVPG